jgi:hypothetical protein
MCSVFLVVKYLIGRSALTSYLGREVNVESDFEGDSEETLSDAQEEKEEQVRAVLVAGSFSAYVLSLNPYFTLLE